MQPSDELMREVVRAIETNTQRLVEFRQDVTRATAPLYPRIVGIEKRLDAQGKALDTIYRAQKWRGVVQIVIVVLLSIIAGATLWFFFGS